MNTRAYFEQIYQQPDPFQYRNRWYEARKRALEKLAAAKGTDRGGA